MDWRWRWRLTHKEYALLKGEKLHSHLVEKIFLRLCEDPPHHDPQHCKVIRRTLAACRLVCRQWSRIATPKRRCFIIRVDSKGWMSPSWYMVKRAPLQIQDGSRRNQESDTGWCTENYREDLMKSHPKFPPELTKNILREICYGYSCWKDLRNTLAVCCLVSHTWNRIFTPVLYEDIHLVGDLDQARLHRTFRQTQPAHKALVKSIMIVPAEDGSTANLLSICFSMPNLRKLILDFRDFNLSALHPNFVQQLRSLSRSCTIRVGEYSYDDVKISWGSLSSYINFTRRARSASLRFKVSDTGCK